MAATDMKALRDYVQGGKPRQTLDGVVLLDIAHNLLKSHFVEIAFDLDCTVDDIKGKIYTMTGSSRDFMQLTLNGRALDRDDLTLAHYGARSGMLLQVIDSDPTSLARGGGLEDTSLVKKYVMTEEEYDKRENTFRAYKKKMQAADPTWKPFPNRPSAAAPRPPKAETEGPVESFDEVKARVKVGDRCQVQPGGRRGQVQYIGLVPEVDEKSVWIGVKYDEPVGKNDGSVKGQRYFTAPAGHGAFVRPALVVVGDFPEEDPFASDEEEEEEGQADGKAREVEKESGGDACCAAGTCAAPTATAPAAAAAAAATPVSVLSDQMSSLLRRTRAGQEDEDEDLYEEL